MPVQNAESRSDPVQRDTSMAAFEFVRELATELSESSIDLPSFPDVAMRVQKVLADEHCSADRVVRVLGAEPMLATRVMTMANSAAMNPGGKAISDLRSAVTRLGFDAIRSAVIGFAMAQVRRAQEFRGIERHLNVLWQHSVLVAALGFVIARRTGKVNADTAMLTGLVSGVGKLYILTRSTRHPGLFTDQQTYQRVVRDWHGNIAKALLENWQVADEIVIAVSSHEDDARDLRGTVAVLADILEVSEELSMCKDNAEMVHARLRERKSAMRLGIDADLALSLINESSSELAALRDALGH